MTVKGKLFAVPDVPIYVMDKQLRHTAGALRSRIVGKLAGLTPRQLGYWHLTGLLEANAARGGPGRPRLYSWDDYMRLRAARKFLDEGVPTRHIRSSIEYLDKVVPSWYLLPVHGLSGRPLIEIEEMLVTAEPSKQVAFSEMTQVLRDLTTEGPLGELNEYDDAVAMNPSIVSGNPVARGTRLETGFLASLADRGLTNQEISRSYGVSRTQLKRVLAFERAAA